MVLIAVTNPLHYQRHKSYCKVNLRICLAWDWSVLFCFISMKEFFDPDKHVCCLGECGDSGLVEVCIILILYIQFFRVIIIKTKALRSNVSASLEKQTSELKAACSLSSVVAAYMICFSAFFSSDYSRHMTDMSTYALAVSVLIRAGHR